MANRRVRKLRIPRTPERSCPDTPYPPPRPARKSAKLSAEVLLPEDSPIIQAEIEVIAALLDDWDNLLVESGKD